MPFTQKSEYSYPAKAVCDGCSEHCKLGACRYLVFMNNGYCSYLSPYYWPTIGGKTIQLYKAADGLTVSTDKRAKTMDEATRLAYIIAQLCDNYKTK